jgi:hypothetical protein
MSATFTCHIPCRPPITYQLVDDVTFCGFTKQILSYMSQFTSSN